MKEPITNYQVVERLARRCKKQRSDTCNYDESLFWDVITALRSFDESETSSLSYDDLSLLKQFTTMRIRAILGFYPEPTIDGRKGGFLVNTNPLGSSQISTRNNLLKTIKSGHFRYHFQKALKALALLGYDVPKEELEFSSDVSIMYPSSMSKLVTCDKKA